jgi:hypothetical protein
VNLRSTQSVNLNHRPAHRPAHSQNFSKQAADSKFWIRKSASQPAGHRPLPRSPTVATVLRSIDRVPCAVCRVPAAAAGCGTRSTGPNSTPQAIPYARACVRLEVVSLQASGCSAGGPMPSGSHARSGGRQPAAKEKPLTRPQARVAAQVRAAAAAAAAAPIRARLIRRLKSTPSAHCIIPVALPVSRRC